MDIYEQLAQRFTATSDEIKSYREILRAASWSASEKLALATLMAKSHNIDEGELISFIDAYGNLSYNQITEQEMQPGQGVSGVNRNILEFIVVHHDELEALEKQCEKLLDNETV